MSLWIIHLNFAGVASHIYSYIFCFCFSSITNFFVRSMSTGMDAIVILDCESSMTVEFDAVRRSITNCTVPIFDMSAHNRIGLIKFRSVDDPVLVVGHHFTNDRNRFQVWLNSSQPDGAGPDGRKALGKIYLFL